MGRAGAPGPSTAQAPKGKGFPCSAGPWRVHCPMHPARSAVAPGALEIGHGPLPSSLGRWFRSSRSDRRAKCPQMVVQGLSQPIPASVGASSPGVDELRRPDQSQDFLFPQKANHHMCLRLSNSPASRQVGSRLRSRDLSIESLEYKELREARVEYKAAGAGPALQLELAPGRKPGESARPGAGGGWKVRLRLEESALWGNFHPAHKGRRVSGENSPLPAGQGRPFARNRSDPTAPSVPLPGEPW